MVDKAGPITERSNVLTRLMGAGSSPLGIVRSLRSADAQLFASYATSEPNTRSVFDSLILDEVAAVAERMRGILAAGGSASQPHPKLVIVMSGCGTSGRIAFLVVREFRLAAQQANRTDIEYRYLIAGGDASLLLSQELPEDDASLGAADLDGIVKEYPAGTRFVFFGITCGISAPYVLGQVEFALAHDSISVAILGFNAAQRARDVPVEGWNRSCRSVAMQLCQAAETERITGIQPADRTAFMLNPSVGPEAVTGSSRMKGGSMTLVLLQAILATALSTDDAKTSVTWWLRRHAEAMTRVYHHSVDIASAIDVIAKSVADPLGHVYYLGDSDFAGMLGFIDPSEMFDTYGESPDKIRGFVCGGWAAVGILSGDLSDLGILCQLSCTDFRRNVLPGLSSHDTVIFSFTSDQSIRGDNGTDLSRLELIEALAPSNCATVVVHVGPVAANLRELTSRASASVALQPVTLDDSRVALGVPRTLTDSLAVKLVFNAFTTAACVLKGRVCGNFMINLGVSNNKLFFRSCAIISELMGVSAEVAQTSLLKAIYDLNEISDAIVSAPISEHLIKATPKSFVLPVALLLASGQFATVDEAKEALIQQPVIHKAIEAARASSVVS